MKRIFFAPVGLIALIAKTYPEILRQKRLSDLSWTSPVDWGHGHEEKPQDLGMK